MIGFILIVILIVLIGSSVRDKNKKTSTKTSQKPDRKIDNSKETIPAEQKQVEETHKPNAEKAVKPKVDINSKKAPLHPKNNKHNFSGYVKEKKWNKTRDGQVQCWLTLSDGDKEFRMSKYIKKDLKGLHQQYELINVSDYVYVTYNTKHGYRNIKKIRVLKKVNNA